MPEGEVDGGIFLSLLFAVLLENPNNSSIHLS